MQCWLNYGFCFAVYGVRNNGVLFVLAFAAFFLPLYSFFFPTLFLSWVFPFSTVLSSLEQGAREITATIPLRFPGFQGEFLKWPNHSLRSTYVALHKERASWSGGSWKVWQVWKPRAIFLFIFGGASFPRWVFAFGVIKPLVISSIQFPKVAKFSAEVEFQAARKDGEEVGEEVEVPFLV